MWILGLKGLNDGVLFKVLSECQGGGARDIGFHR